ncbi:hypothetical protein HZH68_003302 [Vespula germanica]|uniref:Uncharacterized protein n=1 Tax=Vespula germanica TaxID=30212 RepID=A0A834NNV8_VESGE|nr:hypothetical protein HZH68_003302 [Vespula germanica]
MVGKHREVKESSRALTVVTSSTNLHNSTLTSCSTISLICVYLCVGSLISLMWLMWESPSPAASDDRKQHPLAVGQDGKEMPKSRLPNNRMCSCSVPGTTQLSTSTNLSSFDEPPTPARILKSYRSLEFPIKRGFPSAPNSSLIRSIIRRIEGNFLQEGFRFGNEQSKKVIKVYIKRELGRRSMELEMKGTRVKSFKGTRGKHLYPFPLIALLVGEPDLGIDIFSSPS